MRKIFFVLILMLSVIHPQEEKKETSKEKYVPVSFSKEMRGSFNGTKMSYLASHYETILYERDKFNNPMASIFVTEYRSVNNDPNRPVIFIFNGGPGSASLLASHRSYGP